MTPGDEERHRALLDMLNGVRRIRAALIRLGEAELSSGGTTSPFLPLGAALDDTEEELLTLLGIGRPRS